MAVSFDSELGGRDFDEVLAKHFAAEFRQRYNINAESQPKPYIRLLQECEKLKKLMSANTQAIPLNIECFMEDKDVSSQMNRYMDKDIKGRGVGHVAYARQIRGEMIRDGHVK